MKQRMFMKLLAAPKVDLGQGSWLIYEENWLTTEIADHLFSNLLQDLSWEERSIIAKGKEVQQPRLMGWAGELPYLYSGQILEPRSFHDDLVMLQKRLATTCEIHFNHVVANLYRDGKDRVGFHADDEPELGYEPLIASISLGVSRRFILKHKYKKRKKSISLKHGSLLLMGGTCQHRWYHGVPAQPHIGESRINLTFRLLRGAPGWRAPRTEDPRQFKRDDRETIKDKYLVVD